jgi:hypothetical protein
MNIIFDTQIANQLKDKYIVLELDSIQQPGMPEPVVLHALIENTDLAALASMAVDREMHHELILAYKRGDWAESVRIAEQMKGRWAGEIDQFYDSVIDFSKEHAILNTTWDGIRHTVPKHDTFE